MKRGFLKMGIEIFYNRINCTLYCFHENEKYSSDMMKEHIQYNGHKREIISIGVPNMKIMEMAKVLKNDLTKIFDEGRHDKSLNNNMF